MCNFCNHIKLYYLTDSLVLWVALMLVKLYEEYPSALNWNYIHPIVFFVLELLYSIYCILFSCLRFEGFFAFSLILSFFALVWFWKCKLKKILILSLSIFFFFFLSFAFAFVFTQFTGHVKTDKIIVWLLYLLLMCLLLLLLLYSST